MGNKPSKPTLISLEGNIGVGKSTFFNILKEHFANDPSVLFLPEPLNIWESVKDDNNKGMLVKFYEEPKKYGFAFQMLVFYSRYKVLHDVLNENKYKLIFTERCLEGDMNLFAKMSYEMKNMENVEFQIYQKLYDQLTIQVPKTYFVYIDTSVKVSYERIRKRGRPGEEKISIDYLLALEEKHHDWLVGKKNLLTLNGNLDMNENTSLHADWLNEVKNLL